MELYVAEVGDKQLEPARKLGIPDDRLISNYQDLMDRVAGVVVVTPAQSPKQGILLRLPKKCQKCGPWLVN